MGRTGGLRQGRGGSVGTGGALVEGAVVGCGGRSEGSGSDIPLKQGMGVVVVGPTGPVVGEVGSVGSAVPRSGAMLKQTCGGLEGSLLHEVNVIPASAEAMNIDLR